MIIPEVIAGLLDGVEDGLPQPLVIIPEVIAGLLNGVEDGLPQPLALRHCLLSHHLVLLRERVPCLRHNTPSRKQFSLGKGFSYTIYFRFLTITVYIIMMQFKIPAKTVSTYTVYIVHVLLWFS